MTLLSIQSTAPNIRKRGIAPVTLSLPTVTRGTVEELAHLLYNGSDRTDIHAPWRALIADPEFHYQPGLTTTEQISRSYQRLHLVNDIVGTPELLPQDPHRLSAMHEWIGGVDGGLCTLASIHYNLFLGSLLEHDDHGRDLTPYTSLSRTGTFLCTELEHGNDAANLQTTATYDPTTGGFTLHTPTIGAQKFMPNTSTLGGPKSAVVAARLLVDNEDQGVYLFLVPLTDSTGPLPGVTVRAIPSRFGPTVDHCLTRFKHVRLPRTALLEAEHGRLDHHGQLTSSLGNRRKRFLRSVNRVTMGKLCMSASSLGMARTALTIAVRYAHIRHIAGPREGERVPLAAHRSHHGRLLSALATCYALTFLHRKVMKRWTEHTAEDRDQVERMVAVSKSWITWQCRQIAIECRERCGAQGLFPFNNLVEQQLNIEGGITAEGDNLVIAVKAASEMIFGHKTERTTTDEPTGDSRASHQDQLTELRFLRDRLADVEDIWQRRSRTALRHGPQGNPLGRWNAACPPALEMVHAYTRRLAADAFLEAIEETVSPEARTLLENLYRLFALKELDEHTGTLVVEDRINLDHIRELPAAVDRTVRELAPCMGPLVDAFDLPDEYLANIPLANDSYSVHVDDLVGAATADIAS
ncbi:acyl-CoA dehydrogenase family protein [Streptomyces sp. O3]